MRNDHVSLVKPAVTSAVSAAAVHIRGSIVQPQIQIAIVVVDVYVISKSSIRTFANSVVLFKKLKICLQFTTVLISANMGVFRTTFVTESVEEL